MQLNGKTVYITGGTGGIGAPLVDILRHAGAIVTLYDKKRDGDLVQGVDRACQYLRDYTPDVLINMAGYNAFDYCEKQNLPAI
ncbi:MAG: short-chain dehydrogenase, partial [Micavibrio aeruginosavorus]